MSRMVPQLGGMRKVRCSNLASTLGKPEIQASHLKRRIEDSESFPKIGQQVSAVTKALDSTYLRMTVCFMAQELEAKLAPDDEQKADLSVMMKDLEALLARMG